MKHARKLISLLLAMAMILAMSVTAFADEGDAPAPAATTGSIEIHASQTSNPVGVAGKTFNAYKILDLKMVGTNGYVYTVPEVLKDFYATELGLSKTAADFDYQVTQKINDKSETELFAFAAKALAAAKEAGIAPVSKKAGETDSTVTISPLPFGYYVVEDAGTATPISALILNTVNQKVVVYIKADQPTIDKKIDGDSDSDGVNNGLVESDEVAIGDKVPYVVTSKVPDMKGYTKYFYIMSDTLSEGLTFNDDVVITIGTGEKAVTLTKDTNYSVSSTKDGEHGKTAVEIVFKSFIDYAAMSGEPITVRYSATLNEDAVIGTAGNTNTVKLTYSNNPNVKDDGTPENPDKPTPGKPIGETPDEKTKTFVTGLELTKVDTQGNKLAGAKFKITGSRINTVLVNGTEFVAAKEGEEGEYWLLIDGTYTTAAPVTEEGKDNTAQYASTTQKYNKVPTTRTIKKTEGVEYTATTDENGVLYFDGLAAGNYEIEELVAPAGFNKLSDKIQVTIACGLPSTVEGSCTWSGTSKIGSDGETKNMTFSSETGRLKFQVENSAGGLLPTTGGIGTTIFYVLGTILVIGAVIALVLKKRMNTNK